jgi:hypothetical protein
VGSICIVELDLNINNIKVLNITIATQQLIVVAVKFLCIAVSTKNVFIYSCKLPDNLPEI